MKRVQQKVHSTFSPHVQRMILVILGIGLQFGVYVALLVHSSQHFVYFYWICVLVSLVVALFVSTRKSRLPIRWPGSSPFSCSPSSAG